MEAETPDVERFFFDSDGARLFGALHLPPGDDPPRAGLVFCAPMGDEHIASYRTLHDFAHLLAQGGIAVLRFDPPGQGDSEGTLAETPPQRGVAATHRALEILSQRAAPRAAGLLGLRLGCTIALATALEAEAVGFSVAWAPVLSASLYFRDLLRRQALADVMYGEPRRSVESEVERLDRNERVDIGGYALSGSVYAGYIALDFADQAQALPGPIQVLLPERPSGAASPERLVEKLRAGIRPEQSLEQPAVEPFWAFPREGSLPPPPLTWFDATLRWIHELSATQDSATVLERLE